MRISTAHIFQQNLTAMLNQQSDLGRTQLQVSTGNKILSPSDDPAASVQILDLQRELSLSAQHLANADKAENKLVVEEGGLKSATEILQRVRELAVQGLNDTNAAEDRKTIAIEIAQLNEQLLAISNTRDSNGDYLFSGFASNTQPYETIHGTYQGDQGQRNLRVGANVLVESNDPGNQVFESPLIATTVTPGVGNTGTGTLTITSDSGVAETFIPLTFTFASGPPAQYTVDDGTNSATFDYTPGMSVDLDSLDPNFPSLSVTLSGAPADTDTITIDKSVITPNQTVFQTIDNFVVALNNNNVGPDNSPNNGDFLTNISASIETVIDVRARVGARVNIIDSQREINDGIAFNIEKTLSELQDLDYAEAISRLSLQMTGLQAAQQSFVRVQDLNLFNFL